MVVKKVSAAAVWLKVHKPNIDQVCVEVVYTIQ